MFPESNIPKVQITLPGPANKLRMLRTNHPYALCDQYGHYSYCFPHLDEFCDCLDAFCRYKATRGGSPTPLPMDSSTTSKIEKGDSSPTIIIIAPNVNMTDSTGHVLYLSSSLSSLEANLYEVLRVLI